MSGQDNPSYQGYKSQMKSAYDNNASYVIDKDDVEVNVHSKSKIPEQFDDGIDRRCGYGKLKAGWMQVFNKMSIFVFWAFILCFLEGFAVNGIGSAALPSIERQFQLTSTKSALIPSSQDIGALIVVLFVSFIGGRHHKPFIVASGAVIMAFGSFLFVVPHIVEKYTPGDLSQSQDDICPAAAGGGGGPPPSCESSGEKYLGVFMAAQILHGLGFTSMFTLGTVYIHENEDQATAAIYIGLTYAAAAIGVAAGFFAGGQLSEKLFVDFDRVDQESLGFNARDQRWIGAWWVGFIISAVGFLLVAIPIYGYPKHMPGYGPKKESKTEDKKGVAHSTKQIIFSFFKDLLTLIKNPVYMCINLGGCASSLIISGVSAFSFKFLAEQYRLNFDDAGYLIGGLILVGAVGMVMGGVLVRIFRLEIVGMTRLSMVVALVSAALGVSLLAGCPNVNLVGLSVPYSDNSAISGYLDACQGSCDCTSSAYTPVCGQDNNLYYSACHAGCSTKASAGQDTRYGNCSCVASRLNVPVTDENAVAILGRCEDNCTNLNILAPCLYVALLTILLSVTPTSMATLRCVDEDHRSFAIGLQWLFLRLLGLIPGPLLVGAVLDGTCEIWTEVPCSDSRFCMMYDLSRMSSGIMIWWVVISVLTAIFYLAASLFASRNKNNFALDSK
ncbi:solute carrier organic anion transporter family member 4A1-like [Mizuhopecten yessoensis]|uniref:Solute carrier organic anion transporter family member n=1 Tax=Mizuhopecten yessoensis TaxID=6573 RepID=A0A210QCG6_MIZYE|nr:solute carrier organic anion transporter family member 4A1-like [Mizuhopecten yessoensis]OWF46446.1 Solute carrier organic anion transporter family member 4A1 [Mizuhopecten yessoensis]